MRGDPKPHEQLAAQGAEEEHSNGWNLKTCAGPLRQPVEAGCSRGRRCLVGWDSAGVPRFGNGLFDGGPLLGDTCSFDDGRCDGIETQMGKFAKLGEEKRYT